jgi:hypothetical protein
VSAEILPRVKTDVPFSELFILMTLNKAATPTKVRLDSRQFVDPDLPTNVCGTCIKTMKLSVAEKCPQNQDSKFKSTSWT